MSRALIVVAVVVTVLTVYSVVDCAMTDARRTRVLQKPIWLIVILFLPVVGALLWMFIGKQSADAGSQPIGPDEDVDYLDQLRRDTEHDARIRELEEQMRQLDAEIDQARRDTMKNHPSSIDPQGSADLEGNIGQQPSDDDQGDDTGDEAKRK